jgi:hypothetical protein
VALMVDGVRFGEHLCVVALGIDIDGTKHPLSLVEGSTGSMGTGHPPCPIAATLGRWRPGDRRRARIRARRGDRRRSRR